MSFRLKLFLVSALALFFLTPHSVSAHDKNLVWKFSSIISNREPQDISNSPAYSFSKLPASKKIDNRANQLQSFLTARKSPLAPHSARIVDIADKYGLDWKLLVAISGVESGFGRVMPLNSFNAYGWSNGLTRFESWENSIEHVSQVLGCLLYTSPSPRD